MKMHETVHRNKNFIHYLLCFLSFIHSFLQSFIPTCYKFVYDLVCPAQMTFLFAQLVDRDFLVQHISDFLAKTTELSRFETLGNYITLFGNLSSISLY